MTCPTTRFYGWIFVAIAAVAAGWIAILAGFAALSIGRPARPATAIAPTELAAT